MRSLSGVGTLEVLSLAECRQIGDAGLTSFKDCKSLTNLRLQKTKVTAGMIDGLKKALPKCKIEWDGEVVGPGVKE